MRWARSERSRKNSGGAWVALWLQRLTLDLGSRTDLTGLCEPRVRLCADSGEPAGDSTPLSNSLSLQKINKPKKNREGILETFWCKKAFIKKDRIGRGDRKSCAGIVGCDCDIL